ncbi:alpha-N-acetylglucosaminidase TIM-barrel domain-containing protein [Phytohabitans sp. ZYX-F-186]|uniref:Alpha-N-acetylglucosaminidase TIM-barrel domain-containing protein n=1 Tax=Phytohabitans maris TaxID=3071409 RepID=A0ABU0ZWL0_9ACTN|nr:alpha-N-acetylglucosaminidase TIM-barrel domain-containing protein [Phytohabitans sp. ZYX-F-186]MDQ7911196.1 alpha-N-acetylglucosaminidase TIM-barrel domain-containing protein [Phytohabitans sp. ZYX-F-186]
MPPWAEALNGLARRVLGPAAGVRFEPLPAAGRSYEYTAAAGTLTVGATDGVSAAVGLHDYLSTVCGRSVGWDTLLPLDLPSLPPVQRRRGLARVRHGYYLNFCTFSYTMPYWGWAEWEREIDWMALHGITMPLAATGHEAALLLAYTRLGLDAGTVRGFLGGPGYLPFQYMGCLDGFAGPLPPSWVEGHRVLGARVLERERAFGMTPVLPAFTGHVPRQLAGAGATSRGWAGFETWVLDPTDPMYPRIGGEITRAQLELFGTDHLYAGDPFIEMKPVDADASYPAAVASATLAGLRSADPDAVWVMQAWPFSYHGEFWTEERVATFLGAIPAERMVLVDLWAEYDPQWRRLAGFSGKPWLWCALLNFGGRTDPVGDPRALPEQIDEALAAPDPPVGLGLAMEAIHNNPAYFELVTDQIWHPVGDVGAWTDAFAERRYGPGAWTDDLRVAWRGLLGSVYDARGLEISPGFRGVMTARPSYAPLQDGATRLRADVEGLLWYPAPVLADAWHRLVEAAERYPELVPGPLGHDLVEVGIAYMARVADRFCLAAVTESACLGAASGPHLDRFLRVFDDLERMLACRDEYTFQRWEAGALSWATGTADREVLRDNARRVVTVWSQTAGTDLDDYAGRHWAGLVGGYYRDRWRLWADGLDRALADPGEEAALAERLRERAETFLREGPLPPAADLAGLAAESRRLLTAYGDALPG